ncbi:Putative ZDHHC-type palmitoyltransferase 2 (Zinc finger DHHC domain-containing protein 2) [Durusdinium trenchii]|uniref:Palmitoyltransferase n=1 Tax=Durusdinium trenchii TaxID=1381693 RepID=A0ABP0PSR4_9DINO
MLGIVTPEEGDPKGGGQPDEEEAEAELLRQAKVVPLTATEDAPAKIGRIRILRCFGGTVYVGPHWCCSFVMLSVILAIGFSFMSYNSGRGSWLHSFLGLLATLGSAVSFLACATANPGILQPTPGSAGGPGKPEQYFPSNGKRHCTACDIKQPVGVLHCDYCHVCIQGWDHHCPWMNKCIGENNLLFFNSFLAISLSSLGYIVLATMIGS